MPHPVIIQRLPLKPMTQGIPDLGTLWGWYNSDSSMLTEDGGLAVVNPNDPLGYWEDLSGLGHHLEEATNKPTFQPEQLGSYPSVRFDGTNDLLQALGTLNEPIHIFMVINPISWANSRLIISSGTADSFGILQSGTTPDIKLNNGTVVGGTNSGLLIGSYAILEILGAATVASHTRINDAAEVTTNVLISADRGGITLAAHANISNFSNIEVVELIVYSTALNTTGATAVRDILNAKYTIF